MNKSILRLTAVVLGVVVGVILVVFVIGLQQEETASAGYTSSKKNTTPAVAKDAVETSAPASVEKTKTLETVKIAQAPTSADESAPAGDVRAELARFKDTSRPLEQRRRDISILAKRGDARSIEILMALGDENTYLNWAAVEALGTCLQPEVTAYLKGKLESSQTRVLSSALRAYARHMAEAAVPELTDLLKKNRTRPDGYEVEVQSEIVKVLAMLRAPAAVPALSDELTRYKEDAWDLEYGSVLVAALGRIGTPEARTAITAYADGLNGIKPEDPLGKKYFEDKIAQAQAAIKGDINDDIFKKKL